MKKLWSLCACLFMISQSLYSLEIPRSAQVAADSTGNIVAAWETVEITGDIVIEGAYYDASATTWSTPQQLSSMGLNSRTPRVATNGAGESVVIWESITGGITRVYAACIGLQDVTPTWTANTAISPVTQNVRGQSTTLTVTSGGVAVASWMGNVMTPSKIGFFVVTTAPGGIATNTWNSPTQVGGP